MVTVTTSATWKRASALFAAPAAPAGKCLFRIPAFHVIGANLTRVEPVIVIRRP